MFSLKNSFLNFIKDNNLINQKFTFWDTAFDGQLSMSYTRLVEKVSLQLYIF